MSVASSPLVKLSLKTLLCLACGLLGFTPCLSRAADAADEVLHVVVADDYEVYYEGPMRDFEGVGPAWANGAAAWITVSGGVRGKKYDFTLRGVAQTVGFWRASTPGGAPDHYAQTRYKGIPLKWIGRGEIPWTNSYWDYPYNTSFFDYYEGEAKWSFTGGNEKTAKVVFNISPTDASTPDSGAGLHLIRGCPQSPGNDSGCDACSQPGTPGEGGGKAGSVNVQVSLGLERLDGLDGEISLYSSALEHGSELYTPAALELEGIEEWDSATGWGVISSPLVTGESAPQPRQIRLPSVFVDIHRVTDSTHGAGYELRFHHPADIGAYDSGTGTYVVPPASSPYKIWKFSDVTQSGGSRLSVKKNFGAFNEVEYFYEYGSVLAGLFTEEGWTLTTKIGGSVLRTESVVNIVDEDGFKVGVSRWVKNAANETLSSIYQEIDPHGRVLSETVAAGDAALARTSTHEYASGSPTRVTKRVDWTGNWTFYNGYDSRGRPTQWVEQYQNNPCTGSWPDALNRMHERTDSGDLETETETLAGVVVARAWKKVEDFGTLYPGENNRRKITHAVATDLTISSPAWSDASNLKTVTYLYDTEDPSTGPRKNAPYLVVQPDGRADLTKYFDTTRAINGQSVPIEKIETYSGVPNTTSVTDYTVTIGSGTKTVEERTFDGHLVSRLVTDIATGTVIEDQEAVAFDAFGRPTEIAHFGGATTETRSYACCGLEYVIDRDGVKTAFTYDPLGRIKTRTDYADGTGDQPAVRREFVYDALDRKTKTLLGPLATQIVEEETDRNLAGGLAWTKDGLGRKTNYTETMNDGFRVVATHHPDGSADPTGCARIQKFYQDGSLYETIDTVSPTLTCGTRYTYGTDSAGRRFVTQTPLDNGTLVTASAVTHWTDAAGRPWKTVAPSPTEVGTVEEIRFYATPADTTFKPGQLMKITRGGQAAALFTYDALGRLSAQGLDLGATPDGVLTASGGVDRVTEYVYTYQTTTGSLSTVARVWTTASAYLESESIEHFAGDQTARRAPGEPLVQTTRSVTPATHTVVITQSDPVRGLVTETTMKHGRQAKVETREHDGTHAQLSQVTFAYDAYGRLVTRTESDKSATSYTYDGSGRIESITTPDPDPLNDGAGQRPQTLTYAYEDLGSAAGYGRRETVARRHGGVAGTIVERTVSEFYPTGELRLSYGPGTTPARHTYDFAGRIKTLTTWRDFNLATGVGVGAGDTTTWNYNAAGLLENKRHADDRGPDYNYHASGRLHTRQWARSVGGVRLTTTYGYTAAGDLETTVYSDGITPGVTHTPDRAGRLVTTADAAGLLTRTYEAGRLDDEVYTGTGLLSGHSITRGFDTRLRPQTLATDFGYSLGYAYDHGGRLDTVSQGFHLAKYAYAPNVGAVETVTIKRTGVERARHERVTDPLGRTTRAKTVVGGAAEVDRLYAYDDSNRRTAVALEDTRRWAYGYDDLGQVNSAQKRLADDTTPLPGYSFGYTFDKVGNRSASTVNGRDASYTPNALNQYESRQVSGAFDVRGEADPAATVTVNSLSTTRTGADFYREIAATNTSAAISTSLTISATIGASTVTEARPGFLPLTPEVYEHDFDGNLTQDGRWDYTWDAENRLIAMETRAGLAAIYPALKQRLDFAYDAQGRRIRKLVKNWDAPGNTWTVAQDLRFLYDGWNLVGELDALNSGAVVRSYAWGLDLSGTTRGAGGVGGLLWANTADYTCAASADANGNIVAWINTATLAIAGRADYGPFGEVVQQTGVVADLPFGFSSKYRDFETGLNYYGFRYMSPSTGRWLSRDPIGERGGLNLHAMTANDPVNAVDYLGLYATPEEEFEAHWGRLDSGPPYADHGYGPSNGVPITCNKVYDAERGSDIPLLGSMFDSCKCRKVCVYQCSRAPHYKREKVYTPAGDGDSGGKRVTLLVPVPSAPGSFSAQDFIETEDWRPAGNLSPFKVLRIKGQCGKGCPQTETYYTTPGLRKGSDETYDSTNLSPVFNDNIGGGGRG